MGETIIGTELKLNINIEAINGTHMSDFNFTCGFYIDLDRMVSIPKSQMIMKDADNYLALLDTSSIGLGRIRARITMEIPDSDFPDRLRTEIIDIDTGIVVNE